MTTRTIREARTRAGLTQQQLAERAGTSQPAVARLESGRASPNLETLERLVAAAGFRLRLELLPAPVPDPVVEAYKAGVDRTLLRENLRRTPEERLRSMVDLQRAGAELERAMRGHDRAAGASLGGAEPAAAAGRGRKRTGRPSGSGRGT